MEELDLFTRGPGGQLVVKVTIPYFSPRAEVLVWGERIFIWVEERKRYEEGMCYAVSDYMVRK
jgi:hypothetical protein